MKILLISGFFPPTHIAGSEKRTLGYAVALQRLGHSVQVLCAGTWDKGLEYWNGYSDDVYRGVPVRRIHVNWTKAPDPNRYLYANPVVAGQFDRWLEEWQPDIVHIVSTYTLSATVIEVAKQRGLPVLLTLVDFWFICPRLSLLHGNGSLCNGHTTPWECLRCLLWDAKMYRWPRRILPETLVEGILTNISQRSFLSRQRGLRGMALDMEHRKRYLTETLRQADSIVAPSRVLADMIHSAGMDVTVQIIHSGHDLTWLASMPARQPASMVRFGYIGQISPSKGVYELVAAFLAGDLYHTAELHIYGDLGKQPEYTEHIRSLLMTCDKGITLHGAFSPEHLGEVLAQIDVLVVPSTWWENNPRVIQEAFASKAVVIASDIAGISEFVEHETNGLLFRRSDINALTQQMRRVIEEPGLLTRLQANIPSVKTIDQEVEELIAVYGQLLE
jgi:glycosyltransferase involved in cell wall biosynthesis